MPKQPTFPSLRNAMKKKQTRREQFLAQMEVVVPWDRLLALIAPQYPKGGRPPMPLEVMLRRKRRCMTARRCGICRDRTGL